MKTLLSFLALAAALAIQPAHAWDLGYGNPYYIQPSQPYLIQPLQSYQLPPQQPIARYQRPARDWWDYPAMREKAWMEQRRRAVIQEQALLYDMTLKQTRMSWENMQGALGCCYGRPGELSAWE